MSLEHLLTFSHGHLDMELLTSDGVSITDDIDQCSMTTTTTIVSR